MEDQNNNEELFNTIDDTDYQEESLPEAKPETEELDFTKPDFSFIPKATHNWKQQGYWLTCTSCDLEHGTWIGRDKVMVGIDEKGNPIVKTRIELGFA